MLVLDGSPVPLNQLNRLNPNDVEDITILKGASAAALYGPDGVNGVIFVKTLRGSRTGAPQIRVSNSTQFERVSFLPKFQNQFGSGSSVDVNGDGVYDGLENQQYGDAYDGSMREIGHPLPNGNALGEAQMEQYSFKKRGRLDFFETGATIQNDVSYSAKNFLFSAQDANITGTLGGDKNRRTTVRFNSTNEYGRFTTNFNVSYTRQQFNVAAESPYWQVFNTAGHIDLKKYKDWRNDPASSPNHYYNEYYENPYFIKDRSRRTGLNDDLFAQIQLGMKITSWLNLTYRASTNLRSNDEMTTIEAFTFSDYAHNVTHKYNASNDLKASVSENTSKFNRLNSEVFLTAQRQFGDFSIDALVGNSVRQDRNKFVGASGSNLIIPTLFNVSNRTGEAGAAGFNYQTRLIGAFGKLTFGYKSWAFAEVSGRNDWDSRLPQNNRSFFYPGANVSLILSDAIPEIKNSFVSFLKVRGSISKSGNVNLGNVDNLGAYQLDPVYNVAAGFPYGNLPGFQGSLSVNNPTIQPEFVHSKELGVEVSFFKNRVNIEATGYLQNNRNQILDVQVSRATGVVQSTVNAADFDNKGLEFDLRITPLISLGDFRFDFRGNLSLMDSRINSVYQGLDEIGVGNANFAIVGYPAFVFKLTDYKRDPSGRIIVDRVSGYPSLDPNVKVFGNTMPNTILGLTPSLNWKSLTLNVTADYRGGHQVYHGIGPDMDFTGSSARSGMNGRKRFIVPNSVYDDGSGKFVPNTDVLTANGGYGFYEASNTNRGIQSNYLTSAAAWKIREIALIYDLPSSLLTPTKVFKTVTIGLTARNIFTFLPESNQWTDPEFNTGTGNALGVNNSNILPPNRLYGFNVVFGF
jgi:TonB-linked SusC/RagA family outer membrane protein